MHKHAYSHQSPLRKKVWRLLSDYVDTEGPGGTALEIGIDALERVAGTTFLPDAPHHVHSLMVAALRDSASRECASEVILASIAVWAMIYDITDDARKDLMSLLEIGMALKDQAEVI